MLKCRAYGHIWIDTGWVSIIFAGSRAYDQTMRCDRCQSNRRDYRARATFKLVSRTYEYETGYPGKIPRAEALKLIILIDTKQITNSELKARIAA